MKKVLVLLVLIAAFAAVGCGGSQPAAPVTSVNNQCLNGAPDWVIAGGAEGGFTAVGAAQISKAGMCS